MDFAVKDAPKLWPHYVFVNGKHVSLHSVTEYWGGAIDVSDISEAWIDEGVYTVRFNNGKTIATGRVEPADMEKALEDLARLRERTAVIQRLQRGAVSNGDVPDEVACDVMAAIMNTLHRHYGGVIDKEFVRRVVDSALWVGVQRVNVKDLKQD